MVVPRRPGTATAPDTYPARPSARARAPPRRLPCMIRQARGAGAGI